ncbi:MAG: hypothetical protein JKY09_08315, partial [Crocinitomicaceae bacterium]|nr:hypothetical protein [Crocinitomicaceae bacterium]
IGFSTDIIQLKDTRFALGANAGYLFGGTSNTRKSALYTTSDFVPGGVGTKIINVNSFHYELGGYLTHDFNKNHSLGLSAVLEPLQKINAEYEEALYYSTDIDNPNAYDTLSFIKKDRNDGKLTNIPTYSYGLNYIWRAMDKEGKAKEKHPEVSLHFTYSTSDWSKFENTFDSDTTSFLNTSKITFGVQFIPEADFSSSSATTKFYNKIRYRAGFYQYTLPYTANGAQVKDFGTTFGIGIPVAIQKSLSSINVGFSAGRRGVSDKQLLNENYYGINLGITIAPGEAEKWFRRRKLN